MAPENLLFSPPDRNRPVVASDLEGTITAGIAFRGMYQYLLSHNNPKGPRALYYGRFPEYFYRRLTGRGFRQFKNDWILDLLRFYRGFTEKEFREMAFWAVQHELWPRRRQPVLTELEEHRRQGQRVIIVTGLFEPYVAAMLDRLPGLEAIGTPLVFKDGRLTGELGAPFTIGRYKVEKLSPFMSQGEIFAAYGDTISDRFMLATSRHPVAVHPDKALRRLAHNEGWRIIE
jgi:phosphoserine phosphatase